MCFDYTATKYQLIMLWSAELNFSFTLEDNCSKLYGLIPPTLCQIKNSVVEFCTFSEYLLKFFSCSLLCIFLTKAYQESWELWLWIWDFWLTLNLEIGSLVQKSTCNSLAMVNIMYKVLSSQKQYKKDLETEIKGKGMQVGPDTPEIRRAKKASEIASTVSTVAGASFPSERMQQIYWQFQEVTNPGRSNTTNFTK